MGYRINIGNFLIECDTPDEVYALLSRNEDAVTPVVITASVVEPPFYALIKHVISQNDKATPVVLLNILVNRSRDSFPVEFDSALTAFRHLNTKHRLDAIKRVLSGKK